MSVCLVQPIGHISPGGDLALDGAQGQVVPGFASYETLLYSPELKFYSNKVKMTRTSRQTWRTCTASVIRPAGRAA